jgi:hypothetical protein
MSVTSVIFSLPATATLVAAAALMAAWSLKRQLPAHNVLMACGLAGGWFLGMESLNAHYGVPFGVFPTLPGPRLPGGAPLFAVVFWVAALFGSRALARRLLQPWRAAHYYGYWMIGMSVALMLGLSRAVEPAGRGAPEAFWLRQLASAGAVLVALVVVFPWLIRKKSASPPPDVLGPATWFLLWGYFTAANWISWTPWATLSAGLLAGAALFLTRSANKNGGSRLPPLSAC